MIHSKWLLRIVVFSVLGMTLVGCGTKKPETDVVPLVSTITVGGEDKDEAQSAYTGTVRGRYESKLAFQVGGKITGQYVQVGSRVRVGQVLMTLDPQDMAQGVEQANAQVTAAASQCQLAKEKYSRFQALYQQSAISTLAWEQAKTEYKQAQAQYAQAKAARQVQQHRLAYTQLTASADGVVAMVAGEPGQVIGAGMPVLTLIHAGQMEVEMNVPENKIGDFFVGKPVAVSFWALQEQRVVGHVRAIAPMADPLAKTYMVRISLDKPPQGLKLGMTAQVFDTHANVGDNNTYNVPVGAIYQTGNTPYVWCVTATGTVQLKRITIVSFEDDSVRIQGVAKGDVIVKAGVQKLHQGEQVRTESDHA